MDMTYIACFLYHHLQLFWVQPVRILLDYFTVSPLQWQKTEAALCYLYLYIAKMSTEIIKIQRNKEQ